MSQNNLLNPFATLPAMRVGHGFDSHRLVTGRPLIIGGVTLPYTHGLLGHSDADVLLHAITDAILGAAGLGDIGQHFPDNDANYLNADSRDLLRRAYALVRQAGWQLVNIDATIHAQEPKISPYSATMVTHLSHDLELNRSAINIKAKTGEGVGPVGHRQCIEANAIVLLSALGTLQPE